MGGATEGELAGNRSAVSALKYVADPGSTVTLASSNRLAAATLLLSYWTLLIEGAVAASFLAPKRSWLARHRDLFLMAFVGTTYIVLPVVGFAMSLCILGLAQCDRARSRTAAAYLGLMLFVQISRMPINRLMGDLFQ